MANKKFNTDEIAVLLYSIEQKCFHVELMTEYIKDQLDNILYGDTWDFQLIGVFETELEASDWTIENFDWENKVFRKFTFGSLTNKK